MNVHYELEEVKVIAYDIKGIKAEERVLLTAGKSYQIEPILDRSQLAANGKDLAYINVSVVDKDGILCPRMTVQFNSK